MVNSIDGTRGVLYEKVIDVFTMYTVSFVTDIKINFSSRIS